MPCKNKMWYVLECYTHFPEREFISRMVILVSVTLHSLKRMLLDVDIFSWRD